MPARLLSGIARWYQLRCCGPKFSRFYLGLSRNLGLPLGRTSKQNKHLKTLRFIARLPHWKRRCGNRLFVRRSFFPRKSALGPLNRRHRAHGGPLAVGLLGAGSRSHAVLPSEHRIQLLLCGAIVGAAGGADLAEAVRALIENPALSQASRKLLPNDALVRGLPAGRYRASAEAEGQTAASAAFVPKEGQGRIIL